MKKLSEIIEQMSPVDQEYIEQKARKLVEEMEAPEDTTKEVDGGLLGCQHSNET